MLEMKRIEVAAAILRKEGQLFICRRGQSGLGCSYLWEFPGGKLEADETPEACLVRECREELDIEIVPEGLLMQTDYDYPEKSMRFYFINAHIAKGTPHLNVHTQALWVRPEELKQYTFCPADEAVVNRLSKPLPFRHYLWDFDGTLFDSYGRIGAALWHTFRDYGVDEPLEDVISLAKRSVYHAMETTKAKHQMAQSLEEMKERYRCHSQTLEGVDVVPYPGIVPLVQTIFSGGGKHYLYTHRGKSAFAYMDASGLTPYFADFITGDDPYPSKPAPDAILALMKKHGMEKDDAVMVGDRDIDILAGQNAGIAGCLFDPEHFYDDFPIELRAHTMDELQALLLGR